MVTVKNRSVVEIMVLCFTFLVAFSLMLTASAVVIIEIKNPETDTDAIVQSLISLISGILGALLGLIAGKSEGAASLHQRPPDKAVDVDPMDEFWGPKKEEPTQELNP
jgi:uncharacterized membrane protein